jgi:general secretion pathway protein B
MSLILDALRKIELERKAKRQSSQTLRSEVLHYQGAAPSSEQSRLIPVIVALLLISVAVAGFFYFKKTEPAKIDAAQTKEMLPQELTPTPPPQLVQSSPVSAPQEKSLPAEVKTSPSPVKLTAEPVKAHQKSGDAVINVSGIAWQDERSLRRAVINGHLVGEGAEIEGAKIIEIKENRVKFSRSGEIFEVGHSSGTGKP